ncbi:ParB/RepB/Spo0J family partition protein [Streptomyces sp. NPDC017529]|uniref:ParB/RepB/Spo0J family partition protein n=1 Tax=Streptomyces sp. NPDC017529 TaxID=3365000 RepID=UPI0037BDFEB0
MWLLTLCVSTCRTRTWGRIGNAYLALWPEQEQQLGDVDYILVNGERRCRSAVHVGLEFLDFVVRDDLAVSKEDFVDHLLKENLEREDFDVIERARGVQQMVGVCAEAGENGARSRAAQRLGRARSWITNQLALLRLPIGLQAMLSSGELAERDGRQIARYYKEHPEQDSASLLSHWEGLKTAEVAEKQRQKEILRAVKQAENVAADPALSADNTMGPEATVTAESSASSAVLSAHNAVDSAVGQSGGSEPQPVRMGRSDTPSTQTAEHETWPTVDTWSGKPPAPDQTIEAAEPATSATTGLVRQLGATPAAQARALAAGLGESGLVALIEELHAYV